MFDMSDSIRAAQNAGTGEKGFPAWSIETIIGGEEHVA